MHTTVSSVHNMNSSKRVRASEHHSEKSAGLPQLEITVLCTCCASEHPHLHVPGQLKPLCVGVSLERRGAWPPLFHCGMHYCASSLLIGCTKHMRLVKRTVRFRVVH